MPYLNLEKELGILFAGDLTLKSGNAERIERTKVLLKNGHMSSEGIQVHLAMPKDLVPRTVRVNAENLRPSNPHLIHAYQKSLKRTLVYGSTPFFSEWLVWYPPTGHDPQSRISRTFDGHVRNRLNNNYGKT